MTGRSPDEIEREIEIERAALERSIDDLHARLSPERMVEQATDYMRLHGGELAATVARNARENPVAMALAGIGVACLMAGSQRGRPVGVDYDRRHRPTSSGLSSASSLSPEFDRRVVAADASMRRTVTPTPPEVRAKAPDDARGDKFMSDHQYGTWIEDDIDGGEADDGRATFAALRARIADGTESMTEEARRRVIQARSVALAAQEEIEVRAARAARYARDTAENKPLVVGALAFAAGAAFAVALPRTQAEDRSVGVHRDRLFRKAERVFREETAKLRSVATAAVEEGKAVAKDALSGQSETPDAATALRRVSDAAKERASSEKLGTVR